VLIRQRAKSSELSTFEANGGVRDCEAVVGALSARARDEPIDNPSGTKKLWLPRFFVRRSAWHALDHAWEIEDRAQP
jgi:hypothetical protein